MQLDELYTAVMDQDWAAEAHEEIYEDVQLLRGQDRGTQAYRVEFYLFDRQVHDEHVGLVMELMRQSCRRIGDEINKWDLVLCQVPKPLKITDTIFKVMDSHDPALRVSIRHEKKPHTQGRYVIGIECLISPALVLRDK